MSGALGFWLAAEAMPVMHAARLHSDRLDALARRRLARLLRAAARTEFYGARLRESGVTPASPLLEHDPNAVLAGMRPVTKADLRQAGERLLAGGRLRPEWRSSSSSGSSGEPFRVHYDARAWAMLKYLVKLRARRLCGMRPTDRVALLDAVAPARARRRGGRLRRVARISVLQPPATVAAELAGFAPDTVYGLPSALAEAGAALEAGGRPLRVKRIFTSGELLQPAVRARLTEAFGARVFDVYGTSETKEIAWECPAGGMHVNSDVVRVEVLDDDGRPQPDGAEGQLVVTTLVNQAMPLLRYRVGDRGSLIPHRCRCGLTLPLLGIVTGREADVLVLRGGRRVSPYALTCALEQVREVQRYQVTQLDAGRVRVRAILDSGADRVALTDRIRAVLRREVAPFLETEVEYVDRLPAGPRAKFRVVEPLTAVEEQP